MTCCIYHFSCVSMVFTVSIDSSLLISLPWPISLCVLGRVLWSIILILLPLSPMWIFISPVSFSFGRKPASSGWSPSLTGPVLHGLSCGFSLLGHKCLAFLHACEKVSGFPGCFELLQQRLPRKLPPGLVLPSLRFLL